MRNDIKPRFKIGDHVKNKKEEIGIIKEIVSLLGEGYNTYIVDIDTKERMYSESELSYTSSPEILETKDTKLDLDVKEISDLIIIEDEIEKTIEALKLREEPNDISKVCKLYKHLLSKIENTTTKAASSNISVGTLYEGIMNGNYDYMSYTYTFTEILKKLGINSYNVLSSDENKNYYMSNLVELDNKYYFFDLSLDKEIYEVKGSQNNLILCCAGLGKKNYQEYFTPLCALKFNTPQDVYQELPTNISEDDYDYDIISRLAGA